MKAEGPAAEALAFKSAGPLVGHERAKPRLRSSKSNSRASASAVGPAYENRLSWLAHFADLFSKKLFAQFFIQC